MMNSQFMNQMNQMSNPMQTQYQFTNQFNRPQPPVQNNGITWVQGTEGAKAFQLPPNSNVMLLDSENDGVFYIKVSDNVGMCSLRVFNYVEVTGQSIAQKQPEIDMSQYVTREELDNILKSIKGGKANGKSTVHSNESAKPVITE